MKIIGFCISCKRIRYVTVTGAGWAMAHQSGVPQGTCDECKRKEHS